MTEFSQLKAGLAMTNRTRVTSKNFNGIGYAEECKYFIKKIV
jgi:hypothetical protein